MYTDAEQQGVRYRRQQEPRRFFIPSLLPSHWEPPCFCACSSTANRVPPSFSSYPVWMTWGTRSSTLTLLCGHVDVSQLRERRNKGTHATPKVPTH